MVGVIPSFSHGGLFPLFPHGGLFPLSPHGGYSSLLYPQGELFPLYPQGGKRNVAHTILHPLGETGHNRHGNPAQKAVLYKAGYSWTVRERRINVINVPNSALNQEAFTPRINHSPQGKQG